MPGSSSPTIAVDPITVRAIGRRVPVPNADHVTFNIEHHHRHVKDYYVEDPRNLVNPDRTTGASGRPEWPPFNPPEQQWLFNDDLVGRLGPDTTAGRARQPSGRPIGF